MENSGGFAFPGNYRCLRAAFIRKEYTWVSCISEEKFKIIYMGQMLIGESHFNVNSTTGKASGVSTSSLSLSLWPHCGLMSCSLRASGGESRSRERDFEAPTSWGQDRARPLPCPIMDYICSETLGGFLHLLGPKILVFNLTDQRLQGTARYL